MVSRSFEFRVKSNQLSEKKHVISFELRFDPCLLTEVDKNMMLLLQQITLPTDH